MTRNLQIASIVNMSLGGLFILIGFVTPAWIIATNASWGLLGACGYSTCISYVSRPAKLSAALALLVLSFIMEFVGVILVGVGCGCSGPKKNLILGGSVLSIVSAFFSVVGIAVAVSFFFSVSSTVTLGYSFGMTLLGAILALVAGILGIKAYKTFESE
uniref:Uncharacterized LOC100183307 n=1 Tax=Ciona intestinalis TaxID=7719 RepID=F6ZW88_CIOIN|nr:uncharacterized protein LOC100183307 [Ciona intestinalis]|eukprot:XP_002123205.1 uncharacterized protein LOC100183307 [Ciona intestinalis]